jgi:SNW domain-containing protein 1
MADWKIPPCISNWKNAKGYTIPLDKRLAADGRGLMEVQINDGFAKLSESLYVAEAKAREAVETRAKIQRELMAKEKDRKEDELRQLAQQARMARSGAPASMLPPPPPLHAGLPPPPPLPAGMERPRAMEFDGSEAGPSGGGGGGGGYLPPPPPLPYGAASPGGDPFVAEPAADDETASERAARLRRDEIREERRRERERERRLEARDAHGGKRSKLTRDRERDVSEKVALGQASVGGGRGGEALYDQRLFNQSQGLDSGFGADDGYNTFTKPLFTDRGNSLYAPGRGATLPDAETTGEGDAAEAVRTDRFKPDRAFAGGEETGAAAASGRMGPVVFERPPEDDDPFGLGAFVSEVRRGKKDSTAPGRVGSMAAAAGGGDGAQGSGRQRVDFKEGGR